MKWTVKSPKVELGAARLGSGPDRLGSMPRHPERGPSRALVDNNIALMRTEPIMPCTGVGLPVGATVGLPEPDLDCAIDVIQGSQSHVVLGRLAAVRRLAHRRVKPIDWSRKAHDRQLRGCPMWNQSHKARGGMLVG